MHLPREYIPLGSVFWLEAAGMSDYDDTKRKRVEDSDDDEDLAFDDVDEEEDSDSEDVGAPARKKAKRPHRSEFLLDEAEEDSDDDDDDGPDGDDFLEGMYCIMRIP